MFEVWVRYPHGWEWRVIGCVTFDDAIVELGYITDGLDILEARIISNEADRPAILR